ncbi:hypothetical protein HDU76_008565 [Blyttiomyces sp. JEL0837]|nr:hypothetical protein HDU76_008565 [Blyttiomyces sp. JEL0837]
MMPGVVANVNDHHIANPSISTSTTGANSSSTLSPVTPGKTSLTSSVTSATLPSDDVPFFDFNMDHAHLMEGARTLISMVFPQWSVKDDISLIQETDGITKCIHNPTKTSILIRTYGKGSDVLIDRNQELLNMMVLSKLNLCAPLFGRFKNGLVYGYTEGRPFSVPDMRDSHKSHLVASHMARWHHVELPIDRRPKLFDTLAKWMKAATFSNPVTDKKIKDFIPLEDLAQELATLKEALLSISSPTVFSHCDLLSANIIYNAQTDKVSFIDHEYGQYNPRGFDIGNHFCEHAGFDCEWDLYPSREFQFKWLTTYLTEFNGGKPPTQDELSSAYAEVNKYALAAHMFWGVWALVQAEISDLDFDYAEYSKMRLTEYFRRRDGFLAL